MLGKVLGALTDPRVLPKLAHFVMCYASLPRDDPLEPREVRYTLQERVGRDKPLKQFKLLVPDQARGRLADWRYLMTETQGWVIRMQQSVSTIIMMEVECKYCQSCHDGEPLTQEEIAGGWMS